MNAISRLREQGNGHYKACNYEEALVCYSQALHSDDVRDADRAVLHKNRAACFLKLEKYEDVVRESSLCLSLSPSDTKALFRRCQSYEALGQGYEALGQGYEALGQVNQAYKDAAQLKMIEPGNKTVQKTLCRLKSKMDKMDSSFSIRDVELDGEKNNQRMTEEQRLLLMAEKFREAQGSYCEMEMGMDSTDTRYEGMSYSFFRNCQKNPGHKSFVPLPELKLSHLPEACRSEGFLRFVRNRAQRNVKITVFHTSTSRSGNFVCQNIIRCGTGYINDFTPHPGQTTDPDAPLTSPVTPDNRIDRDLKLFVQTAAHVVFDDDEVKQTRLELFFDDDHDRLGVVKAEGVRLLNVDTQSDWVTFIARLSSPDDATKVIDKLSVPIGRFPTPTSNVTFTVSHPHGVAKRVTFGSPEKVEFIDNSSNDVFVCDMSRHAERVLGVSQKCFLFYNIYGRIHRQFTETTGSGISPIDQRRQIIRHLLDKELIDLPTEHELTRLHNTFGNMLGIKKDIVSQMLRDIEPICTERTEADRNNQGHAGSDVMSREEFTALLFQLRKEYMYKFVELWKGKDTADKFVGQITASYFLDTCPGSSGCLTTSFIVENIEKPLMHIVPHSKGRTQGKGISGGGSTYVL